MQLVTTVSICLVAVLRQPRACEREIIVRASYCCLKPISHQTCGTRAPICDDKFIGFVRQPHGVVNNTTRLPYEKQRLKAAATNFRHVHFLCDLFAFSERCTTATRHTRLSQDSARHARCSYDWRYSSPATHLSNVSHKTTAR